uniref:Very-long-chain (3R)-3-hydroxyacyl-CoA dehydratase n=3 Tax=Oryza TaxID=4527 RepID=A0A0E0GYC4_ORYNI
MILAGEPAQSVIRVAAAAITATASHSSPHPSTPIHCEFSCVSSSLVGQPPTHRNSQIRASSLLLIASSNLMLMRAVINSYSRFSPRAH